jgi:hypothetical protein
MFFDRDEEVRDVLRDALRQRDLTSIQSRPCASWLIGL